MSIKTFQAVVTTFLFLLQAILPSSETVPAASDNLLIKHIQGTLSRANCFFSSRATRTCYQAYITGMPCFTSPSSLIDASV